jgi:EAL domain-containing protein (putative c-di-GMP-specific phosphodiesterase class I)
MRFLHNPGCARDLELEVTEHQLFDSEERGGSTILKELRARGIGIALDDFGTGYSSLSRLRSLPINTLKLDQTFTQMIPRDSQSCAIARAMIGLAHTLHLEVVAEGVESIEQVDFFRQEDCEAMQGYFFSKPLPPDAMTIWLQNQNQPGSTMASPLTARSP